MDPREERKGDNSHKRKKQRWRPGRQAPVQGRRWGGREPSTQTGSAHLGGPHLAGNNPAGGMQQHPEIAFVYSKVPVSRFWKWIKKSRSDITSRTQSLTSQVSTEAGKPHESLSRTQLPKPPPTQVHHVFRGATASVHRRSPGRATPPPGGRRRLRPGHNKWFL